MNYMNYCTQHSNNLTMTGRSRGAAVVIRSWCDEDTGAGCGSLGGTARLHVSVGVPEGSVATPRRVWSCARRQLADAGVQTRTQRCAAIRAKARTPCPKSSIEDADLDVRIERLEAEQGRRRSPGLPGRRSACTRLLGSLPCSSRPRVVVRCRPRVCPRGRCGDGR